MTSKTVGNILALIAILALASVDKAVAEPNGAPVILSTDVAIGLIDTHGGKSLSPVVFNATHPYTFDTDVTPQDIDDGLTLAMALNLDAAGVIELIGVIPTYGNATLPAEMLVARQIVRTLKGRRQIPIVPGATGPARDCLRGLRRLRGPPGIAGNPPALYLVVPQASRFRPAPAPGLSLPRRVGQAAYGHPRRKSIGGRRLKPRDRCSSFL